MQVEEELVSLSPDKGMLLTIGVFDGVHLGHKYLISQLKEQAKQQDCLSGVITFSQHPQEILSPQTRLPYLTTIDERIKLLKNEGVDQVIALSFTREIADLRAHQLAALLQKHLKMQGLVIGPDFALGKDREGNASTLRKLGQDMNFTVAVIPPIIINGEVVSSTAIRNALAAGDMKRAYAMIGSYFQVSGRVVTGTRQGIRLGFPTANVEVDPAKALPIDGVYATWAYIDNKAHQSMTYVGKRPTFGSNQRSFEVYILDYDNDLYGQELRVDIIEHLRGDKEFNTTEELKRQIAKDIEQGRAILTSRGNK